MKYYQELTLLPTYEIPLTFVWSKVYQQLHLAFVEQMDENEHVKLGVSFPEYTAMEESLSIGTKTRIFAEEAETLKQLNLTKFLSRLQDYTHITSVRSVPTTVKNFSVYSRVHQEGSSRQKARRYAKRHSITYDEAIKLFPNSKKFCAYPYVQMQSLTNQQNFRLFIKRTIIDHQVAGKFGTYGLGDTATVPEF